ncbi:MAG: hypothetical protein F6K28_62520 [Microcoleus sp. SIO2G3]|nr:hypothetical protein [Microcoleus sp. SIO2G3]
MLKNLLLGLTLSGLTAGAAWAQSSSIVPLTIVSTTRPPSVRTIREVGGYPLRFNYVIGSGALIVNADRQVTGYYFTVGDLDTRTSYTYAFYSGRRNGEPTSCEGAKNLTERETAGEELLDLSAIAPLTASNRGVAFIGSPEQPIALPQPVPLD